jgi:RNA polymerase sigma-70 factor (ECF subfamily)
LRQAPADQSAWGEFVERYGPKIYGWCRHWGLQESDAEDVTQDVLLKLAEKMRTFAYDASGSFRAWLKTLTHHAWQDFLGSRHRAGTGRGGTEHLEALHTATAREDLLQRLEEEFDRELLEAATTRVRLRVQPHTWEAFRLLALEGRSGAEVAEQLKMKVATVFVARSKVQKMLQEEMQRLEKPDLEPAEKTP